MSRYARPAALDEALALMAEGRWRVLAGGTDFYPAQGARPIAEDVLDIGGLTELRGIAETPGGFVIGARTTWSDVIGATLPSGFAALREAAREVGAVQIQNAGTVGGNLCNASPAADGVPPLLALDAEVELRSASARRMMPLGQFILGNRRTALQPGELLTGVHVPRGAAGGRSAFLKLGARRYLVISIAMAAVRLEKAEDGTIARAAVAVGACSPVAARLGGVEAALRGAPATCAAAIARETPMPELSPIDDVRGSAAYRVEAAREIVARALAQALSDHGAARAAA